MKIKEAVEKWQQEYEAIVAEIRDFKSDEYKSGLADGIEMAIESLLVYLEECDDY
ncbi:MAG: hypothetical protein PWQ96_558 [Clostridia bacterium]|jgi:hypothetical protein|nr:hypothetical protein [Clostridiales bacterium]MDK2984916.1 hypothetical protein [Clostridia bacterium]